MANEENRARAARAQAALDAYRKLPDTDPDASWRDLLCDLWHLADIEEVDFMMELDSAYMNYKAERDEQR
jgi:hypothetical protein